MLTVLAVWYGDLTPLILTDKTASKNYLKNPTNCPGIK